MLNDVTSAPISVVQDHRSHADHHHSCKARHMISTSLLLRVGIFIVVHAGIVVSAFTL